MTIDIGQNEPGALAELIRIRRAFAKTEVIARSFPQQVCNLAEEGSAIARLMEEIPDPPVDPRLTISYGITSATGTIRQVFSLIQSESGGTTPIVLQSLARTALLGSARVVYMLGPEEHEDRLSNMVDIMALEGKSLMRAYKTFSSFESLGKLVPPPDIVAKQADRLKRIGDRGRLGEQGILNRTAAIAAQLIALSGLSDSGVQREENEATLQEAYQWVFNTFSGTAHGFAWPSLVPGTSHMSGHFISDFGLTVDLTYVAADLVARRRKARGH